MRVLVTGANGQLGHALRLALDMSSDVVALDRHALDLADADATADAVWRLRPTLVVNAAAYTAVDRAEQEPDAAFRVNAGGPAALARSCARLGAALVHFSTDYVFDGTKHGRYVETDLPNPLSVYGRSKLEGERAVLDSGCAGIVLRTSWVYGEHGGNFAKTMLRLATERTQLKVVADQHGAPTWAGRLADFVRHLIAGPDQSVDELYRPQAQSSGPKLVERLRAKAGLYHASAAGQTTWFDYARMVIGTAAEHPAMCAKLKLHAEDIEPIPTSAYPTPARRPLNSLLDCSLLERTFEYRLSDWHDDAVACVRRMLAAS